MGKIFLSFGGVLFMVDFSKHLRQAEYDSAMRKAELNRHFGTFGKVRRTMNEPATTNDNTDVGSSRVKKLRLLLDGNEAIDNFDGKPMEKWSMASAARSPQCQDGKKMIGGCVPLKFYMQHIVEFNDPNRGTIEVVRSVIISQSGDMFQFTSDGVYDSLRLLITYMGNGPWDPPIPITLVSQDKGSRTFYYLEQAQSRIEPPEKTPH